MIKAVTKKGDLLFGITAENVKKLKEGKPIRINLKDMGLEERLIFIVYGETEEAITLEFLNADVITTETKFHKE